MGESHSVPVSGGHFVWKPPARDIAILLNLNLVDRLKQAILDSPEQEIGGLLLGRSECDVNAPGRRIVSVDGFEPLESEHVRGPAFVLSHHDQKGLAKSIARLQEDEALAPVGLFRSHLRKGLYLDEADFSLFRQQFSGPGDVFLIARPVAGGSPVAGFFHWEDGRVHRTNSYSQFPLDRAELEAGDHVILGGRSFQATPPKRDAVPAKRTPRRIPFPVGKFAAVVFGVGLILAAAATAYMMHFRASEPEVVSPQTPSRVPLRVERKAGSLLLTWNADSPQVRQAGRGLLTISDGGQSQRLEFDADRLKAGSYSYTPQTNDVNFKLDLLRVSPEATGSVRFVAPDNGPAPPTVATSNMPPAVAVPAPRDNASRSPRRSAQEEDDDDEEPATRPAPSVERQTPAPPPVERQSPPVPIDREPSAPRPAPPVERPLRAPSRARVEPTVSVTTEALPPPKYREVLSKVPLLRHLQHGQYKGGDAFVPPKLSHEVMPRTIRYLPGEWRLDLKLNVDSDGSVTRIQVLTPGAESHIADAAVDAAERWRFEPATLHGRPVSSEILATLKFHNPSEITLPKTR